MLLMSITLGVSAQNVKDSVLTSTTSSNIEQLVDKYSAKIEASIISLSETLKQPAEFVYGIMIKQQYVKAVTHLAIILLLLLIGIVMIIIETKILEWNDPLIGPFGIAIEIVALIWLACAANMIFGGFINPDYGAIQDITNLFK